MKDKYIFIGEGDYYNYGQIIDIVDSCILVRLTSTNDLPSHSRLYHLECLAHSEDVFIFENRQEIDSWLEWMDTPSTDKKPKIVKLRKDN